MHFLILEKDNFARQIMTTLLESKFSAKVSEFQNSHLAKEELAQNTNINFIIYDYQLEEEGADFLSFLQKGTRNIPCIIAHNNDLTDFKSVVGKNLIGIINKKNTIHSLISLISSYEESKQFNNQVVTHCKVSMYIIRKLDFVNCDLYLKLSEKKFIKLCNAGESPDEELFKKYEAKDVDSLYILVSDADLFIDYLMRNFLGVEILNNSKIEPEKFKKAVEKVSDDLLKRSLLELNDALLKVEQQDGELNSSLKLTSKSQELVKLAIKTFDLTPETETLVKASVFLSLKVIKQNPVLSEIFEKAIKDGGDYYTTHSVLLSYASSFVASSMDWSSDFTRYKLSLASFLHDVYLSGDLAGYQSMSDFLLEKSRFSDEEINLYITHPEKSAELVSKMSDIPPDVELILLHHHERPDGSGFPGGLKQSKLPPLSSVFIIAHDLVNFVLEKKMDKLTKVSFQNFLNKSKDQYSEGRFKEIYSRLSNTTIV